MQIIMNKNIQKVLFIDLFGVLLGLDYSKIINYISSITGPNSQEINYDILCGEYCMKLERGEITFDTYFNYIQYKLPLDEKIKINKFYSLWKTLNVGVLPIANNLEEYSKDIKLNIITNTTISHIETLKDKYNFFQYINQIITSDLAGYHKPNPLIYQYSCSKAGVNYSDAIFIDDSITNVNSAKALGILTHHYRSYKKFKIFFQNIIA